MNILKSIKNMFNTVADKLLDDVLNHGWSPLEKLRVELGKKNPRPRAIVRWHDAGLVDSYGRTPLIMAAYVGNTTAIEALIGHGVDLSYQSETTGATALSTAIINGNRYNVELLLKNGADPALGRASLGDTPLDIAISMESGIVAMECSMTEMVKQALKRAELKKAGKNPPTP